MQAMGNSGWIVGMIDDQSLERLHQLCKSSLSRIRSLKYNLAQIAIQESYMVWCMQIS